MDGYSSIELSEGIMKIHPAMPTAIFIVGLIACATFGILGCVNQGVGTRGYYCSLAYVAIMGFQVLHIVRLFSAPNDEVWLRDSGFLISHLLFLAGAILISIDSLFLNTTYGLFLFIGTCAASCMFAQFSLDYKNIK